MKFSPHFLRIAMFAITFLPILGVGILYPISAKASPQPSEAEQYVLNRLRDGKTADLSDLPKDKRSLRATFIARLLTTHDPLLRAERLSIGHALITGPLNLEGQEIPYDVSLFNCEFLREVNFSNAKFTKNLELSGSTFVISVVFDGAIIGRDLIAERCRFASVVARFDGVRVGHDFRLNESSFDTDITSFVDARIGGDFLADQCTFQSLFFIGFESMRVEGIFSARDSTFIGSLSFYGSRFTDVLLNNSNFEGADYLNFNKMEADLVSFDGVKLTTSRVVGLQRMRFKYLTPVNVEQIKFLLARYNAGFYTDLETSFRINGYPDEADKVFIAKKRAERRDKCPDLLRQCDRGAWILSLFEDMLAGYGKRLQNLLGWSLGFLLIGALVFRSEQGMRTKDRKDGPHLAGKYHAFWYSLDLFLPIIKLGEADVWTPKDNHRWANLYRKVHIIIGSLFVPIGLAAWTGIIK